MMNSEVRLDARSIERVQWVPTLRHTLAGLSPGQVLKVTFPEEPYRLCMNLLEAGYKYRIEGKNGQWEVAVQPNEYPPLETGIGLHDLKTSPDGDFVYCADRRESLWIFETAGGKTVGRIKTGEGASHLDLSPDRRFVYVANAISSDVAVIDTD